MQTRQFPLDVLPSSFLPAPVGRLIRPIEPMLLRMLFPDRLLRSVPDATLCGLSATRFAQLLLENLDIHHHVDQQQLKRIPTSGSALIVANHPFGFLEGLLLLSLLDRVRPDFRIVANGVLGSVPALREKLVFVNPFDSASPYENRRTLRGSLEWLSNGGMLVIFPAGEVAHLNWREGPVADPEWSTAAARLARKTGCVTVPLFFEGANSPPFQMMGTLHPGLRTLNLARELVKKSGRTIQIRIGHAIPPSVLKGYPDAESATAYLRARTYLLSKTRSQKTARHNLAPLPELKKLQRKVRGPEPIIPAVPPELMRREIATLPSNRLLTSGENLIVVRALASEIPNTLREIGRCRELTYREVGEGTGRALDTDEFDNYYQHIILWDPEQARVAGAYRAAATNDVLPKYGVQGLYTSTLFHYQPQFFESIGPALELGRSFLCADYQKQYAPLLLLWKGILKYVQQRPECAILFGAVSVSSDYNVLSQTLIVNFLNGHISSDRSNWIRPRRGFKRRSLLPRQVKQLSRLLPTLEELSSSIQDLEADGKGLPVLLRQYLKVGGELLGFNVDPQFSNALDVLLMADLRLAAGAMLERSMGRGGAEAFRAFHNSPSVLVQPPRPARNHSL